MDYIKIRGARQHNLKNINLDLPKNKLIVFTGLSGSGKSSLALDTIYAEGQRRYVESLSSYARQFLGIMDKPNVDSIEGLSPSISIDQKSTSHNPRSTVGTVTEIYDYLRLLFAKVGHPHCQSCGQEISRQTLDQIKDKVIDLIKTKIRYIAGQKPLRLVIFSPVVRDRKGEFTALFENLKTKGYSQARIDGQVIDLTTDLILIKTNKHTIEVLIDKLSVTKNDYKNRVYLSNLKTRLIDALEQALALSEGLVIVSQITDAAFVIPKYPKQFKDHLFSERFACPICNINIAEVEPRSFSFNSPHGACEGCSGLGRLLKIDPNLLINPNLSVSEGGILPFANFINHKTWFTRIVETMASLHQINLRLPLKQIPSDQIKMLLYGTGDQVYQVEGKNRYGRLIYINEKFTGFITELERRYAETDSDYVRYEIEKYMRSEICSVCQGTRLKPEALKITVDQKSIAVITNLSIDLTLIWINNLKQVLNQRETIIAQSIIKEISVRLQFLQSVGLNYLTLARSAVSLAGGETQRIRLASQIGSGLSGVLYVLDEPSIGLHQRDNYKLIDTLKKLRDLGNTVIVVEHDREIINQSDWVIDFGPSAGKNGGKIIFAGTPYQLKKQPDSITAKYLKQPNLTKTVKIIRPKNQKLTLIKASANNLKQLTVDFPLGNFICVTGVSGSGKSTLIVDTLYHALKTYFNPFYRIKPGKFTKLEGVERIDKVILVDQSPIGRTPRSNPATYTTLFTYIRDFYGQLPEARIRGYLPGRFSFNVRGGRCEACEGEGQTKIEMQFLADIYVTCDVCQGFRYNSETLEIKYKGKSIADVLQMTVYEAQDFFAHFPNIISKLNTLADVGLSYIQLGQPAPTLSGGEAQRVKLATELSKRQTGRTLYILDEPTTGLHFADLIKLLQVLIRLVNKGNTVIVIEHNLDVIKNADFIIDLGPEGGERGGELIAYGTPVEVSTIKKSYTGRFLQNIL